MLIHDLEKKKLIHPPKFVADNCHYLTMMGSVAYGVSNDNSDMDLYGFCIPNKEEIFPHLRGEIPGFGKQKERFEQWQEHHVVDPHALAGKGQEYDFTVYNIVKYFQLLMENNPNMVDSLFTPRECVLHVTQVGNMVRDARKIFLHKGCWHKFKGYAFSQQAKMETKSHKGLNNLMRLEDEYGIPHTCTFAELEAHINTDVKSDKLSNLDVSEYELISYYKDYKAVIGHSVRAERVKIEGYDRKFAYHIIRLLDECEQILTLGDLNLQRAKEHMKAVRRGDFSKEEIQKWFSDKESQLEEIYAKSTLPWGPDEGQIKALLLQCLEHHYGSLDKCIVDENKVLNALRQIQEIVDNTLK